MYQWLKLYKTQKLTTNKHNDSAKTQTLTKLHSLQLTHHISKCSKCEGSCGPVYGKFKGLLRLGKSCLLRHVGLLITITCTIKKNSGKNEYRN